MGRVLRRFPNISGMQSMYKDNYKNNVSTLVTNQERFALVVLRMNCGCETMLNFPPAFAFNGCFASGAGIHPWIITGRAWTGASEARIGHTPFHLLRNQEFTGIRKSGIKRPSNRKTRLKAKFCAKSLPVDAVACRTDSPDPGVHFRGPGVHFRPFARDCGPSGRNHPN